MNKYYVSLMLIVLIGGVWIIKSRNLNPKDDLGKPMDKDKIIVTSDAFEHHGNIPARYTCDGEDAFPALRFEDVPSKAKTLAIICDDPDAPNGLWVHWIAFNIPASTPEIKESDEVLSLGAIIGTNSWNKQSWGGPCPPSGTHHYFFKVYALDTQLALDKTARNIDLVRAMQGHIIGYGELMGLYARVKTK